ncbi:hypothetical protein BJ165DRAFT_924478 [Panaeolus papilionaceus]|nr:hypothetical protein BJ165DRAFT_924478 [Panaeolus papilionaceus]
MSFSKLSTELVVWVAMCLRPEDVVRLGKTCKRMAGICEDKLLWKQLALQMCYTNGILVPHDFDRLAMKEHQDMATAPARVLQLLRAHRQPEESVADDKEKDVLPALIYTCRANPNRIDQVIMIPGGRYMVTLSGRTFHLRDLQAMGGTWNTCLMGWKHPQGLYKNSIKAYAPTFDQRGLRILVSSSHPKYDVRLYTLTFENPESVTLIRGQPAMSAFELDASAGARHDEVRSWRFFGKFVLHINAQAIIFWDHQDETYGKINVGALTQEFLTVTMNGSKLWLICKGRIIGWTLPDLVPLETYLEQTCALIPPEFEISLEAPSKTFGRLTKPSCLSSMNWYNNVDTTPLTFFDLVWKTRGRDRISTFPLECLYAEDLPTTTVKSKQTLSIPGLENQDNQGIYNLISRDTRRSGDFYIKSIYSSKTR